MSGDKSDSTHVRGQVIHLGDSSPHGLEAVREIAEIQNLELMGVARTVFRILHIHAANPVALGNKPFHQMVPDKTACAGHNNARIL